jgi:hypothetical protein
LRLLRQAKEWQEQGAGMFAYIVPASTITGANIGEEELIGILGS